MVIMINKTDRLQYGCAQVSDTIVSPYFRVASGTLDVLFYIKYYPSQYYEQDNRGIISLNIFFNGKTIGTYKYNNNTGNTLPPEISYLHLNYLGTPVILTNENATTTQVIKRDVWGSMLNNSYNTDEVIPTSFGFTGQKWDGDSSLTYSHARYLSNTNRIWLSQDPMSITGFNDERFLLDPQAQNSYSYVKNNPINNIDPDGKWWKEAIYDNLNPFTFMKGQQVMDWKGWGNSFKQTYNDLRAGNYGNTRRNLHNNVSPLSTAPGSLGEELGQASQMLYYERAEWKWMMNNPELVGGAIGVGSIPMMYAGTQGLISLKVGAMVMETSAFVGTRLMLQGGAYLYIFANSTGVPKDMVNATMNYQQANSSQSKIQSFMKPATDILPNFMGEHVSAASDLWSLYITGANAAKNGVNYISSVASKKF